MRHAMLWTPKAFVILMLVIWFAGFLMGAKVA